MNLAPLERCKLWPGSIMEQKAKLNLLTPADLQDYRNRLLRVWNDKEAGPTRGEKDDFIAFAQAKPADEYYNPYDGNSCALAQFLAHQYPTAHFPGARVGYYNAGDGYGNSYSFIDLDDSSLAGWQFERDIMNAILDGSILDGRTTTWGALASRLAAIKQPETANV